MTCASTDVFKWIYVLHLKYENEMKVQCFGPMECYLLLGAMTKKMNLKLYKDNTCPIIGSNPAMDD
jgi:hypothetical protein